MVAANMSMLRSKQAELKFFKDRLSIPKGFEFFYFERGEINVVVQRFSIYVYYRNENLRYRAGRKEEGNDNPPDSE